MLINDYSDLEIEVEISQTPVTVDFSVDQAEVDLTEEEIAILRGPAEDLSLFVRKEQTIAGVDLQDNITKNELLTALNVQDGAEANAVDSVNGKTGAVVLTASDVGALPDDTVIPTVNNGTLTIQKNGSTVATFSANQSTNQTANITVPTQASDVNALPNSTKYGASIDLSINSSTYVVTAQLKDQDGNNIGSAKTIDLPIESVVVSGSYDDVNKKIILTLQSGSTIEFSVADLVSGLVSDTTTIAGLRLNQNISAGDLRTALNVEDGASAFNEDNVIAGSNITITKSGKNVTINSSNYTDLPDKPSINSVTLSGNKTSSDLGLQSTIDSSHKLSADLVEDGETNKVYTATEQSKLSGIESGAEVNDIASISAGGTALTPDANKNVNIPIATQTKAGLVKVATGNGVGITSETLYISRATTDLIDAKSNSYRPIVPSNLDYAIKVGVTTNTNTLTDTEKTNTCNWLGALKISSVKTTTSSTAGEVYDVTYINTMLGNIESLLSEV